MIHYISEGYSDAQIADRLNCSKKTVGKHVEHLLARLGAETRLGAAHRAEDFLRFGF